MRIITISRQFGSGGRELGKRMADVLGYDYYDNAIITAIAKESGRDEASVEKILDNHGWKLIPLSFSTTFTTRAFDELTLLELLNQQKKVIEQIGKEGKDCVIVGRNADVLLEQYHPFNIYVVAPMRARIARCNERKDIDTDISAKEMEKRILEVDKSRSRSRSLVTDRPWGEPSYYDLTINTEGWDLKELAYATSDFANRFFEKI